jgi:hypothetical protein
MTTNTDSVSTGGILVPFGLISALLSILFYVLLYLNGTEAFMHPIAFLSYVIPIIFAVVACRKARKQSGFLEFGLALRLTFGIQVISFFAVTLFSYVLMNFIDLGFAERMLQLTIQKTQEMLEKFKVPQSEIDKQIKGVMSKDLFSLGSIMQNFAISCIVLFLFSLIIAAFVKKNKPEFQS